MKVDTVHLEDLADILEAPSQDGHHLGPTDSALAAAALRAEAARLRAAAADAHEAA